MKRRIGARMLISIFLTVLSLTSNSWISAEPGSIQLVEVGEFHGDEVSARTGEEWLGLYGSGQDSLLIASRVMVETVHDEIADESGQKTGKRVSVESPLVPRFLVKGAAMLSEGPVTSVFEGMGDLKQTNPLDLKLGDKSYVLKVAPSEDTAECPHTDLPRNARLVLVFGELRQVLYSLDECGNDAAWRLLWAGDLDRDGKLDLYVSVTQHYNVSHRKLFLSSKAGDKRLVREVAEFVTSGC